MSYFGRAFVFDSVPCETYDLMLYDLGGPDDSEFDLPGTGEIVDETVGDHWKPYFYGVRPANKLEFDITFGVNERRIDKGKFLDRYELAEVAGWLGGHKEYKWLLIDQPDMHPYGYRCIIQNMQITPFGKVPWALRAHVVCDSPYAYLNEIVEGVNVNGTYTLELFNPSPMHDFYLPTINFTRSSGTAFSITNAQDDGMGPALTGIPSSVTSITIDNAHGIITNNQDLNLYEGFNFRFLRLAKGYNTLTVNGNGRLAVFCEYPVNIGG